MNKKIIVINAGSSSIKFQIYNVHNYEVVASGLCERIFIDGHFKMKYSQQVYETDTKMSNHVEAIEFLLNKIKEFKIINDFDEIVGVGHRVAQGGAYFKDATIIDEKAKQEIANLIPLAPLHNKPELDTILVFEKLLPHVKNVASFDTTFHTTMPDTSYTYAIDPQICKKYKIRRYGFHGNSYKFINEYMEKLLNKKDLNLIVCHLGNGASICGIKDGKSYITSMGLTPLEGVIMGTRSGDFDPSIVLYLVRQGMSIDQIDDLVNKRSGVQGFINSADMRDLLAKIQEGDEVAKFTINLYANRVAKYIVEYINLIGKNIDAIIFTAGIGENSAFVVEAIMDKIKIINLSIDSGLLQKSYSNHKLISNDKSVYPIYCVRTNEEIMIAKDVLKLLNI
jgi:acetate kinase